MLDVSWNGRRGSGHDWRGGNRETPCREGNPGRRATVSLGAVLPCDHTLPGADVFVARRQHLCTSRWVGLSYGTSARCLFFGLVFSGYPFRSGCRLSTLIQSAFSYAPNPAAPCSSLGCRHQGQALRHEEHPHHDDAAHGWVLATRGRSSGVGVRVGEAQAGWALVEERRRRTTCKFGSCMAWPSVSVCEPHLSRASGTGKRAELTADVRKAWARAGIQLQQAG